MAVTVTTLPKTSLTIPGKATFTPLPRVERRLSWLSNPSLAVSIGA